MREHEPGEEDEGVSGDTWPSEWLARQHLGEERRFTQVLVASAIAHVSIVTVLAFSPSPAAPPLPDVLRVDLVGSLGAPPRAVKAAPAPKPTPLPPAAAAKPKPAPKQVVLPKQAPKAVSKRRTPPPRLEYDDALAKLRGELGEAAPDAPGLEEAPIDSAEAVSEAAAAAPGGVAIAPELARWVRSTQQHVRSRWITPPEFLDRGLVTMLEVTLTSTGALLGSPQVVRGSGDPFFDDNAVRAVMRAAPLPAPPEPGLWRFAFRSASR